MVRLLRNSLSYTAVLFVILVVIAPVTGIYVEGFSVGWEAFWSEVTSPMAWSSLMLSIQLALVATLINLVIGTTLAWTLVRYRFWGRGFLNALIDLPFALPTAVSGLILLMLLGPESWLGQLAQRVGFEIVFQPPAIVLAMMFATFPFVIRTVQPLLEEIDKGEEEAAYTLGARRFTTFRKVIFPAIRSGLIGGGLLAYSRSLAEFGAVVLVAGNIPGKTLLASVYIFGEVESANPQGAAAVSIMLLTVSFLILLSINLFLNRRVSR